MSSLAGGAIITSSLSLSTPSTITLTVVSMVLPSFVAVYFCSYMPPVSGPFLIACKSSGSGVGSTCNFDSMIYAFASPFVIASCASYCVAWSYSMVNPSASIAKFSPSSVITGCGVVVPFTTTKISLSTVRLLLSVAVRVTLTIPPSGPTS